MVSDQIVDKRTQNEQQLFPWWWRQPDATKRVGGKPIINPAYLYELGRRHLIREQNHPPADYPPVLELFSRLKSKLGQLRFQLTHHFELEAIDPVTLIDSGIKKMTKTEYEKITKTMPGYWSETQVYAWNLEAPWAKVERNLKAYFKDQQAQHGVKSRSKAREIQAPHWQNLEIWDCWAANLDIPERFFGGAPDHQRKVWEVARSGEVQAPKAERFLAALKEF